MTTIKSSRTLRLHQISYYRQISHMSGVELMVGVTALTYLMHSTKDRSHVLDTVASEDCHTISS